MTPASAASRASWQPSSPAPATAMSVTSLTAGIQSHPPHPDKVPRPGGPGHEPLAPGGGWGKMEA
ncbi:hypothetical protein AMYX_35550 [Anaeromyxobacter diazotrophicus]|uniref:Uncharacterized protein n=1 Tax=Anaeromyxobacter diazotrophicus TaxID=2590199 RepID=A0A7I9VQX3_9BACT|nr:hypothetical protein AMYX_35550 [Anaeromyxobacter diazotrophicus]